MRIAFVASNTGTSARAIHDAASSRRLRATTVALISDNGASAALAWARNAGMATAHVGPDSQPDRLQRDAAMRDALLSAGAELVVLSGFNRLVGPGVLAAFPNRILNVHPAPLPEFGGKGMFGLHVHEAVLAAGVAESAVTVHVIDEQYDHGPTVAWAPMPVRRGDRPEDLADRALGMEGEVFVRTLDAVIDGRVNLDAPGQPLRFAL